MNGIGDPGNGPVASNHGWQIMIQCVDYLEILSEEQKLPSEILGPKGLCDVLG